MAKAKQNKKLISKNSLKLPKLKYNKEKFIQYYKPISIAIVILGVLYLSRTLIFSAFVNGKPVYRLSVIKSLETQYGQEALNNEIEKALISQEAKKAKVVVTKDDIATEITRIEELLTTQGTDLDSALALRGQTRADLEGQIKIQKEIEAILGPSVTIADEEVSDYFDENKDYFGSTTKLADVEGDIYDQLYQQKLVAAYNNWISDLKTQANINYLVSY